MKIDKLPTKKGMQDAAMLARKVAAIDGINKVNEKIRVAAANGKFEVAILEDELIISTEMIEKIRQNGFRIKKIYGEIDDYGKYYMGAVKISWKETFWDKLIKIFFKGDK